MTHKEYILDSLVAGGEYGECITQIKQHFNLLQIDITIEEIKKNLETMIAGGLVYINKSWKNEKGETPYVLTDKGRECWSKASAN